MKVSVVILNWNTRGYLKAFLSQVIDSSKAFGETVVADSASTDGSIEMLIDDYPDLKLIPLDKNYGFTGGYNRALSQLDSEYFVLLNSDIKVTPGWLGPLVSWMDSHPDCAVCGPKLHSLRESGGEFLTCESFEYAGAAGGYVDRFGYPFCRGRVLKKVESDYGQYDSPRDVMWISGACMLVRRSVWEDLGGLDENFFAHMEEIDFCWRAILAGWKVTCVPESVVYHLGGGTLAPDSPLKLKLNFRNNLLLLKKNLPSSIGPFKAALVISVRMALDWAAALVYLLTFRYKCFLAVGKAHNEFRQLKDSCQRTVSSRCLPAELGRMMHLCILPLSFIKGNKIFKWLKHYEDNN